MMKKRWISLFVENDIGVLARISGLFSGKSYNLDSLTVGRTEDPGPYPAMTISLTGDDMTFEQVKKQLARCVEVIKVVEFTRCRHPQKRNHVYQDLENCTEADMTELFRIAGVYQVKIAGYSPSSVLLESVRTEEENDELAHLLEHRFTNRMEIVRGGGNVTWSRSALKLLRHLSSRH